MDTKEGEYKIPQQVAKVVKESQKWPEYRVKQMVKRRLQDEGWIVSTISCSTEPGKHPEATKGPRTGREALKGALVDHFQDLVHALGSLSELLNMPEVLMREDPHGWRPSTPERRNRLLLQALRDSHVRESPLWSWWDSWNQSREAYDKALSALRLRVTGEIAILGKSYPRVSLTPSGALAEVLFYRGSSIAHGGSQYDPSMLRVSSIVEQQGKRDGEELLLGESTRLAAGQDIAGLKERLSKLMEDMKEWAEVKELAKLYGQMAETKDKIEEEIEVLSLRRAFPGHCRLCPI